jgi:hypothetical protein
MTNDRDVEKLIEKVELSHQAVAKTVSGFGHELKQVQTKLDIFIDELKATKEKADSVEKRVDINENTVKTGARVLRWSIIIIMALIGTITTLGSIIWNNKNEALASQMDLKIAAHEKEDKNTVNEIKDYINKITKKDLISINNAN